MQLTSGKRDSVLVFVHKEIISNSYHMFHTCTKCVYSLMFVTSFSVCFICTVAEAVFAVWIGLDR